MIKHLILAGFVAAGTMYSSYSWNSFTPYVVVGAAYSEESSPPEPVPDPKSEDCDSCNGTGKVGDGRVMFDCAVCDGTGKITKEKSQNLKGIIEYRTKERDRVFELKKPQVPSGT